MDDRNNTIAGWVLFAGIIGLGAWVVSGEMFRSHVPEKGGWQLADAEGEAGAAADKPIEFYLATADAGRGEQVFKKCAACHTINVGGANGLGPGLYGVMGKPHGAHPGFAFTDALKSVPGVWDWKSMDAWLTSPRKYAPGTKMTFAGLGNPQDRADIMLYLNAQGSNLPVPPPPAEDPAAAGDKAAAEADDAGAQKAGNQPILNEQQAVQGGSKNVGGEGAAKLTGTDPTVDKQ
ncbi:c-type cytochrome [Sphingomonas mesophila]|uniref:c-type cytochrome n=1 Tax=Sphingomonas mesophila TaxID=2303576 RepID=UPI000E58A4D1|nr:cytochrome c family protein [Sphingomonas mesophila]